MENLSKYDVIWDSPSKDSSGSMPLGNGDLALNLWVEENGDLVLLLAKGDAWDEQSILLKLGQVRVRFEPSLPVAISFSQRLNLSEASIEIGAGDTKLKCWVDANAPVVHIEASSESPRTMTAAAEIWRSAPREVKPQTGDLFCNLTGKPLYPTVISPDHVFPAQSDQVAWCHHNAPREHDAYEIAMRLQGLGDEIGKQPHPLKHRTFGVVMEGDGLHTQDDRTLASIAPASTHALRLHALTQHPSNPDHWRESIEDQILSVNAKSNVWTRHVAWWRDFWNRSWIEISSASDSANAFQITRAFILQRFMNACAGRSEFAIKHNGSLFSVGRGDDPDFRRWGAGYWFMNQRLVYWPFLMNGDFDLMLPWLRMYLQTLPLQIVRTKKYFGHAGAHYPETITFWGAEVPAHYGWTPFENRERPEAECPYLTYYWSGAIELILILTEYSLFKNDREFAAKSLAPFAREIMLFFQHHYLRDETGKLRFDPAQALETWHQAINPLPEIAGLKYVLGRLLALPDGWIEANDREQWAKLLAQVPELPTAEVDGVRVLLPAEQYDKLKNRENPEMYAVFPYRLLGCGKPDLETARQTFSRRKNVSHTCWSQDDIQMALMGMTKDVQTNLIARASDASHSDSRFPAFWNAFSDWNPDIDHGGVLQLALQFMLMQHEGKKITLLPAWPENWDASFKLHAPFATTVEGDVRSGKLVRLVVTPPERRQDVSLADGSPLP